LYAVLEKKGVPTYKQSVLFPAAKLLLHSLCSFLQCGKSAAVFACAREQGFNVIEVLSGIPFFSTL